MPTNLADGLRAHVRAHNISVLAATLAALVISVVGWLVVYGASYWVAMLVATVRTLGERGPGPGFDHGFLVFLGAAMLLAVVDAWLFPHEESRDSRTLFGHAVDLLLFLPRITVAAVWNLTAWARLPRTALQPAVRLLERLRAEKTVPLHELPLDIPAGRTRHTVLRTLQITQLVQVRSEKGQLVLQWSPLAVPSIRSLPDDAHDDMADMRRATVLEKKHALPGAERQPALEDRNDF